MTAGQHRPAPRAQPAGGAGPPVDLVRAGEHLVLTAVLPGVRPADLRLSLVGDRQIYIEGTAPYRHPVPREALVLAERRYGPFARAVALPLPVAAQQATVTVERGLLTARLPLLHQRLDLTWEPAEG